MTGKPRFTAAQMIQAIRTAKGLKSEAARELGCSWYTVHRACRRHPTVQRVYEETREEFVDLAEKKLRDKVNKGADWAVKWVLATLGKNRGYVERVEQKQTGAVTITVIRGNTRIDRSTEDSAS